MEILYAAGRGVSRTRSVPVRTSFKVEMAVTVRELDKCPPSDWEMVRTGLTLVETDTESSVRDTSVDIGGEVVQDLKG